MVKLGMGLIIADNLQHHDWMYLPNSYLFVGSRVSAAVGDHSRRACRMRSIEKRLAFDLNHWVLGQIQFLAARRIERKRSRCPAKHLFANRTPRRLPKVL